MSKAPLLEATLMKVSAVVDAVTASVGKGNIFFASCGFGRKI